MSATVKALKFKNCRLYAGSDKWLTWNQVTKEWVVRTKPRYHLIPVTLYRGKSESKAVKALLEG